MQRITIGIISLALVFFGIGLLGAIYFEFTPNEGSTKVFASIAMRAGLVLGAIWLALPQLIDVIAKSPRWFIAANLIGLLMVVVRGRTVLFVAPMLLVLWFLRPRKQKNKHP